MPTKTYVHNNEGKKVPTGVRKEDAFQQTFICSTAAQINIFNCFMLFNFPNTLYILVAKLLYITGCNVI